MRPILSFLSVFTFFCLSFRFCDPLRVFLRIVNSPGAFLSHGFVAIKTEVESQTKTTNQIPASGVWDTVENSWRIGQSRSPADRFSRDNRDYSNRSPGVKNNESHIGIDPSGRVVESASSSARRILEKHCFQCHGKDGSRKGGIDYILDFKKLIENGKVIAGNADDSQLINVIEDGIMPPDGAGPTQTEIEFLRQWISEGAQAEAGGALRSFISEEMVYQWIEKDLNHLKVKDPSTALHSRYFTLTPLYNLGVSDDKLRDFQNSLSLVINSLSWANHVVPPVAIDPMGMVFRIDIRNYHWSRTDWEKVAQIYPYRQPVLLSQAHAAVRAMTRTNEPLLKANWFSFTAARPPLYHDLLALPTNLKLLEQMVGINIEHNIRLATKENRLAIRAGFHGYPNDSQVAFSNRVLERHSIAQYKHFSKAQKSGTPLNKGAFWISYDFDGKAGASNERSIEFRKLKNNLARLRNELEPPKEDADLLEKIAVLEGQISNLKPQLDLDLRKDIFETPLGPDARGFNHAGGEIIYNLPNGLQTYLLVNNKGARIDEGPTNIVYDHLKNTPVINGISCMGCHLEGIKQRNDRILPHFNSLRKTDRTKEVLFRRVESLYGTQPELDRYYSEDSRAFSQAVRAAKIETRGPTLNPITMLSDQYENNLSLEEAAAELDLTPQALDSYIRLSPLKNIQIVLNKLRSNSIPRKEFELAFKLIQSDPIYRRMRIGLRP